MSLKTLVPAVLLVAATACAPKATSAGASDEAPRTVNRDRNLITLADLDADPTLKAQTVLDVIRNLRPQMLNSRGTQTVTDAGAGVSQDPEAGWVHASLDGSRVIDVKELGGIHAGQIYEIRLLSVAQAMQKFGSAARQGPIILVTTQKQ